MIRMIVGLGNPGPEYEATRHNAGFWWVAQAAAQLKTPLTFEGRYHGVLGRATGPHGHVWLLQPLTFMNLSGKAVAPLARFYKILPEEILVVHDELDLPPGEVKLKKGGSAAGHNGLKDIQAQLGAQDFWRLRLGIGHPGQRGEVAAFVLRRPPLDERLLIDAAIERSLKPLRLMLEGDMDKALQRIHAKPPRPKPPRQDPGANAATADPSAHAGAGSTAAPETQTPQRGSPGGVT